MFSRRGWLQLAAGLGLLGRGSAAPPKPVGSRRVLYNYDAWGPVLNGNTPEQLLKNVDMFVGTQVTTIMFGPNIGQSMNYPTKVSEMVHTQILPEAEQIRFAREMGEAFVQATERWPELWRTKQVDGFGLLVERSLAQGFETFATFRMNDVHMLHFGSGGPYSDPFYRSHPEYRVPGRYGLNYGLKEVREYRLRQLEELITMYPFQGLELDFARSIPFFANTDAASGSIEMPVIAMRNIPSYPLYFAEESTAIMSEFVGQVRALTERVSRSSSRQIALGVRVPSMLSGCRRVGLDPVEWHKRRYLDYLTTSPHLQLCYDVPIQEFKKALPGLPVYGCLDCTVGGLHIDKHWYWRTTTPEMYRGAAAALYAMGADGMQIFNMYVPRGYQLGSRFNMPPLDDPIEVLRDLHDPAAMERKSKLYLVDSRFDVFDFPLFDAKTQLPQNAGPANPVTLKMRVAERTSEGKRFVLRVEAEKLPREVQMDVQVNGYRQANVGRSVRPRIFQEVRDFMPPDADNCMDFAVNSKNLQFGENEIVVMSSVPVTVKNVELGVSV